VRMVSDKETASRQKLEASRASYNWVSAFLNSDLIAPHVVEKEEDGLVVLEGFAKMGNVRAYCDGGGQKFRFAVDH